MSRPRLTRAVGALKADPGFSKALAVTLFLLLLQAVILPIPSLTGRYKGEVYGDLSARGHLWAHQRGEEDWVHLGPSGTLEGQESIITIDVWNASWISVADEPKDFPERADNYTIPNRHFRLETSTGDLTCPLLKPDVRYDIADLEGNYMGKDAPYSLVKHASHVAGHGNLHMQPLSYITGPDFPYQEIYIGNATLLIEDVPVRTGFMYIDFLPSEPVTVSIEASGYLDVSDTLTVYVDGMLSIEHFAIWRGLGHAKYSEFRADGNPIEVCTLRTSNVYSHWSDVYEPLVIEVRTSRDIDVDIGHGEGFALLVPFLFLASVAVTAYIGRDHFLGLVQRALTKVR